MLPIKQRIKHDPANGQYGDCWRAAMASVLDLPYESVPHICEGLDDSPENGVEFNRREREFLLKHGHVPIKLLYSGENTLEAVLTCLGANNPNTFYFLGGRAPRGAGHIVVCLNNKIVHDPHPDDCGITGPLDGF